MGPFRRKCAFEVFVDFSVSNEILNRTAQTKAKIPPLFLMCMNLKIEPVMDHFVKIQLYKLAWL
jgi:hypothetical protein